MTVHEKECTELIQKEMMDGIMNHGLFASPHEGLAIIEEEVVEAYTDMNDIIAIFHKMKSEVFSDNTEEAEKSAEDIACSAKCLMIEAMQVAAMAEKYIKTFGGGQNDEANLVSRRNERLNHGA